LCRVPSYQLVHPAELIAYGVLGVAGGFISLAFTSRPAATRLLFRKLPVWSAPFRPALGGLAIGV